MLTRIQQFATKKTVLIFLGLDLLLMFGLMPMMGVKLAAVTDNPKPLDLEVPTYTVAFAHEKIASIGEEGRQVYKSIELTVDLIYPLVYGFAYALIIAFFFQRAFPKQSWTKWLLLIPMTATVADWAENLSIVSLINRFPAQPDHLAQLAATFSLIKWVLFFSAISLILVGAVLFLLNRKKGVEADLEQSTSIQ